MDLESFQAALDSESILVLDSGSIQVLDSESILVLDLESIQALDSESILVLDLELFQALPWATDVAQRLYMLLGTHQTRFCKLPD
jgi:hypothetical protein